MLQEGKATVGDIEMAYRIQGQGEPGQLVGAPGSRREAERRPIEVERVAAGDEVPRIFQEGHVVAVGGHVGGGGL